MSNRLPHVSVGLAVYNGENFIKEAIDSILTQTFEDFELIISDNASTDKTQEICLDYAAKDQRIRYYRNDRNLGAAWNQNRVFELSTGTYFKLAAHDDVIAPEYLAKCVEALDQNPDVVLCHSWTRTINEQGETLEEQGDGSFIPSSSKLKQFAKRMVSPLLGDGKMHITSPKPRERFRSWVCTHNNCYQIFGLMRRSVLEYPIWGNYGHADGVFLAKLSLVGPFYEIPEYLFSVRKHAQQSDRLHRRKDGRQDFNRYAIWWDPDNQGRIMIPRWKIFSEYWKAISEAPISLYDRGWCYFDTLRWLRGSSLVLADEAVTAARQLLSSSLKSSNPNVSADDSA